MRPLVVLAVLVVVTFASTSSGAQFGNSSGGRVSVIVDTDLGRDDVVALALLSGRKDVRLRAVTVSGTGLATCPGAAQRAARFLRALGQRGVPVACGPDEPLKGLNAFPAEWRFDADRLGRGLPPAPGMVSRLSAPDLLADAARRSPGRDVLLTLGPLTNVAEALRRHPQFKSELSRVVSMVGAVRVPGNVGAGHDRAEMNAWVDPVALQEVFDSGLPITLVPLDATNEVPIDPIVVRDIKGRSGAAARLVTSMIATQRRKLLLLGPTRSCRSRRPARHSHRTDAPLRLRHPRRAKWRPSPRQQRRPNHGGGRARPARFHRLLMRAITRNPNAEIRQPVATINVDIRPARCDVQAVTTKPGDGWVHARNQTHVDSAAAFVQLRDGKTVEDVRAFLNNPTPPQQGPPSWATIRAFAEARPGAQGWDDYRNAPAGTYAIVCFLGGTQATVADTTVILD